MKSLRLLISAFILFSGLHASAQIQSVTLQASGLTCSMCSRAIYKALEKVSDVASVQEDIEHTSYHIQFSDPGKISLENLKKAVTDAGFSVAWMEVKARFNQTEVASDSTLKLNEFVFYFVNISKQKLNGERRLLIVDKDYLLEKDRKKYAGSYNTKAVGEGGEKIFHVTLPQS
jgi:copper chaperone CopZ